MCADKQPKCRGVLTIKKAMIIDDEPDYLALMTEFSAHSGLASVVLNQWDAGSLPLLTDVDILFLDIHMPNKDGIDVIYELGTLGFKGGVVIMSGAESRIQEAVVKLALSLNLRYLGTLNKPFRLAQFKRLIDGYQKKVSFDRLESPFNKEEIYTLPQLTNLMKDGSIYPVYQPQVDSQTEQVTGIECLTRMEHALLGMVPPPLLISNLSKSGLIDEFTLLLITQALGECSALLEADRSFRISFNIVSTSLSKSFIEKLIGVIEQSTTLMEQIILEITETYAISLSAEALYCVAKCRAKGISLSLDDFGTGYATVKQLYDLPFNEIKIDRSFIADITNEVSNAIVQATINIGRQLHYRLIAEGVETEQQKAMIDAMGPVVIQGYYYSKPVNIKQLIQFLNKKLGHSNSVD